MFPCFPSSFLEEREGNKGQSFSKPWKADLSSDVQMLKEGKVSAKKERNECEEPFLFFFLGGDGAKRKSEVVGKIGVGHAW